MELTKNITNFVQIPLGYITEMLNEKSSLDIEIKPFKSRKYTWSWAGGVKHDREEMINKFSTAFPNGHFHSFNHHGGPLSPNKMMELYHDAIFVPAGLGCNNRLECFRVYESMCGGSIPIVVGNKKIINETYYFNNDKPGIIYAETWDEAVEKCKDLLNKPEELEDMQKNIVNWWRNKILSIRSLIKDALNDN